MSISRLIYGTAVVLSFSLTICGCSTLKEMKERGRWPFGQNLCANRTAGELYIDTSDIDPLNVRPEEALSHTIRCTYCGTADKQSVQVELIRRVILDDKVIKEGLELQNVSSGTNEFSREIKVGEGARPGIYFLDTAIRFDGKTVNHRDRFNVNER